MEGGRTEHTGQCGTHLARSAPSGVRLAIVGALAALLAGAVYLIAVRGEALLLDLSSLASRVWCF